MVQTAVSVRVRSGILSVAKYQTFVDGVSWAEAPARAVTLAGSGFWRACVSSAGTPVDPLHSYKVLMWTTHFLSHTTVNP